jgi:Glycosyl hydrolase family 63 C-terminal domain
LAKENPTYQSMATKFFEHFLYIAGAMANVNNEGINLWDEEDEFFYDVLHLPNNERLKLKVRSMVGLIPLFAVEVLDEEIFQKMPEFTARLDWFLQNRPDLANLISRWGDRGKDQRHLLSLLRGHRMKRLLKRMLDEKEFLSPYGVRALSRHHLDHPYVLHANGSQFSVKYKSGESDSYLFGGNSNWRGPVWFPVNYLIIESLQRFHHYYGDDFKVEHPTGSGNMLTLREIAAELSQRLIKMFKTNSDGLRPMYGDNELLQTNHEFKNHLLFYEYFDGDTGRGLGANHQTGWTGLVAKLIQPIMTRKKK